MDEDRLRKQARKRVDSKLRFRKHFQIYVFVNVLLAAINLLTWPHYLWFLWVVCGWGIAIALEGWRVYGPRQDPGERERMIEEEMSKISSKGGPADS